MSKTVRRLLLGLAMLAAVVSVAAQEQETGEDRFFDSKGVRLRFVDVGRGHPVILVHGFSVDLDSNWRTPRMIETLAKDFRVVALDCRGHGKSDKPHGVNQYGLQFAGDVVRLMDHLQLPKAHLVGYSMGATIVGKLVATHPHRIASAVLGAGVPYVGWTEKNEQESMDLAASLEKGEGMRPLVLRLWPTDAPPPSAEVLAQRSLAALGKNDPIALARAARQRHELAVTISELESSRVRLLAVVGSADPVLTGITSLAKNLPPLKVVVVEGASHAGSRGLLSRPEFVAAVHDFLKAQ